MSCIISFSLLSWKVSVLSLFLLLLFVSVSRTHCRDFHSNSTVVNRIDHHDDHLAAASSERLIARSVSAGYHQATIQQHDDSNHLSIVHSYESFNEESAMFSVSTKKRHDIIVKADRSLQILSNTCANNEKEIFDFVSNAPEFSQKPTRINLCSQYISINASTPNNFGYPGISVQNKVLEFYCNTTDSSKNNCILDAQYLSRHFFVLNSSLTFYNINFINGNGTKDILHPYGGSFYVQRASIGKSAITMINCCFMNNTATFGGAIYIDDSTLTLLGSNSNSLQTVVKNNEATQGGFIDAYNSILEVSRYNIINNKAKFGGALCIRNSVLRLLGGDDQIVSAIIQNNVATENGGFIDAYSSILDIQRYIILSNTATYGGALCIRDSNLRLMGGIDKSLLMAIGNNFATKNGGFVDAYNSVVEVQKYIISNNTAANGGAVCSSNSIVKLLGSIDNTLTLVVKNNTAKQGGFLYASNSNIEINKYNLIGNTATFGGAICIDNSTLRLLGGDDSVLLPMVAENNVAINNGNGGFIDAYNSTLEVHKYKIINNTATFGGAICIQNSALILVGNDDDTKSTIFEKNVATRMGGVIFADLNSTVTASQGNFLFRNNAALDWGGGAIYVQNCSTTLSNIVFENNFAQQFGGAVLACSNVIDNEESSLIMKNIVLFNNTSGDRTAPILLQESKISLDGVSFQRPDNNINQVDMYDLYITVFDEDDNDFRGSRVNFPRKPPPQKKTDIPQQTCIKTETELRKAFDNCKESSNGLSCIIDICKDRLQIGSTNKEGISISNKNIILNCQNPLPAKRCTLDGLGLSRMFYGFRTNFTVFNIIFANGFHPEDGGAIKVIDNSIATFVNCSFVNNMAQYGSAIFVNNSKLAIEGVDTSIINNTGMGPPITIVSSQSRINHASFGCNKVSDYEAEVIIYNSTIDISDVHFLKSTVKQQRRILANSANNLDDCDVHVSVYADNFTQKFSCMQLERSKLPLPTDDFFKDCTNYLLGTAPPIPMKPTTNSPPAQQPSLPIPSPSLPIPSPSLPAPSPSPSPTTCFSGENLVETQDFGHIQMSQLRVGDFVRSSNDKFTQVYGFGHFNHEQVGTYLRISFDTAERLQPSNFPTTFIEISSSHLVMMEKENKQIRIRAADVMIGDELSGKKVVEIQTVDRRGVYAPLTQSGDIVVSNILASNYVDVLDFQVGCDQHTLGHVLFAPQRLFCHYFMETCKNEIYINGFGILTYIIVVSSWIFNKCQTVFQMCLHFF